MIKNLFSYFVFLIIKMNCFKNQKGDENKLLDSIFAVASCGLWARAEGKTRPDTRLPQSRAGGQGPFLRSLHHFGRRSEAKDRKKK